VGAGLTSSAGQLVADVVYENGAPVPAKRLDIYTGTTGTGLGAGMVTWDLSAYSSVELVSATITNAVGFLGGINDPTLATYTLSFVQQDGTTALESADVVATFLCTV